MLYCEKCQKEVVLFGVSLGAMKENELEKIKRSIEAENKIILFNPPPIGPYQCPVCFNELIER